MRAPPHEASGIAIAAMSVSHGTTQAVISYRPLESPSEISLTARTDRTPCTLGNRAATVSAEFTPYGTAWTTPGRIGASKSPACAVA